jgi:drug/metabolite transporter (DMT)-like permease
LENLANLSQVKRQYLFIVIAIYFLYNVPIIGNLFKALVNQKGESNVHTHGSGDLVKVIITTLSIILFNIEEGSGGKSEGLDVFRSIILGYGLLIVSLLFDGLMALKEKIINHEVHHEPKYESFRSYLSWEYMYLFSLYSLIFCTIGIAYSILFSNFYPVLIEYLNNKEILFNLIAYAILASIGQAFIFQFLEKWGPLTLSIITGVRKILSIALSIIFFGKAVSFVKVISLLLGTTVIGWEVFEKSSKKGAHGHHGPTPTPEGGKTAKKD